MVHRTRIRVTVYTATMRFPCTITRSRGWATAVLVAATAVAGCGKRSEGGCPSVTPASWRAASRTAYGDVSPRHRIAQSLVRCHTLLGRSRSQVVHLLGHPTKRFPAKDGFAEELLWLTGPALHAVLPSLTGLMVRFDRSGRCVGVDASILSS
jgi:hypothetical protein